MSEVGLIEVVEVCAAYPGLRRIVFKGDVLATFPPACAAAHLKLFFPRSPEAVPDLSFRDPGELVKRTYSVRRFSPESRRLTVDFVVHAAPGAASDWARHARPGSMLGLAGPIMLDVLSLTPEWNLFIADLCGLPMVSALLEVLPSTATAHVLLELPTPERVKFDARCQVSVLQRVGDRGQSLTALLGHVTWPTTQTSMRVCVAAESTPTVVIRRHLQNELRLPAHCLYTVPFWKYSVAEEDYHDLRHEEMDAMEN